MDNIGFIGLGNMGLGMANNILKNKNELNVFTRTKSKIEKLIDGNIIEHDSIKSIASKCNDWSQEIKTVCSSKTSIAKSITCGDEE